MVINTLTAPEANLEAEAPCVVPPLWNPDAAGVWSLFLTPIFGSILILQNWKAIGDQAHTQNARIWLIISIVMLIPSFFIPLLGGVYIITWYFVWQRKQANYVKEHWGKNYPRRGWMKPLSIGIAAVAVPLVVFPLFVFPLIPTVTESYITEELIKSLRQERIEQLYYDTYPIKVTELMVRPNIVSELISAYDSGGDDLFRFNIIVILNHRSALSDSEKEDIAECLGRAVNDSSSWVRTEAVWGLGILGETRMIPAVIPLLDDPDPIVVNEATLTLQKLTGIRDLPISNQDMSEAERKKAIKLWKEWWKGVRLKPVSTLSGEDQTSLRFVFTTQLVRYTTEGVTE